MSRQLDRDRELLAPLAEAARRLADVEVDASAGPAPAAWHRLQRTRDGARASRPLRWAVPAVAVVALALGGWWVRRPRPLTYAVEGGQVEANGYVSRAGDAPTALRFSDGTRVELARGTRMSVGTPGPRGARLRVEDGQAHFEVTHRPGADWSVEAGPYRVQVTGTVFDVRWSGGDEAVVALRVGSVRVTGPHLAASLTLAPGQRLVARLATGEVRLQTGDGADARPLDDTIVDAGARAVAPRAAAPALVPPPAPEPAAPPRPRAPRGTRAPRAASVVAFAPEDWPRRVASGDATAVLAEARAHVDEALADVDAPALAALADAARYAGDAGLCERTLSELRRRFPASAEARTAAFQLGRLADDRSDARAALAWYQRYGNEAPRGPFAAEAFGREMLDVERLSGRAAAAPAARAYLERFPEGPYLPQARAILGLP